VTDWATITSLATAGGTLVLAVATFSSVRSANRSARVAEQVLQAQTRPVLAPSRMQDDPVKVSWGDDHWSRVPGGHSLPEIVDGNVYLAISIRNLGAGIAVIHGWHPRTEVMRLGDGAHPHAPIEDFRPQMRDMYVATGDVTFWQGAIRDSEDPERDGLIEAISSRRRFALDILYSDHNGGQRAVSRFVLTPVGDEGDRWLAGIIRHWNIDHADPRH
jgi:hypothetical protein